MIYKSFADYIEPLNYLSVGPNCGLTEEGRAYYDSRNQFYFSWIHFKRNSEGCMDHERIAEYIHKTPELQGRIYAGTAGEANLEYIAASRSPAAILYDINPYQRLFWKEFFARVAESENPEHFVDSMKMFGIECEANILKQFSTPYITEGNHLEYITLEEAPSIYEYSRIFENNMVYNEFYKKFGTALGRQDTRRVYAHSEIVNIIRNPDLYNHIHRLAKANAIGFLTLDIADPDSCQQLAEALEQFGEKIGLLYTSNIIYYFNYSNLEWSQARAKEFVPRDFCNRPVTPNTIESVFANLRSLVAPEAHIIRFDTCVGHSSRRFDPVFDINSNQIQIPKTHEIGGLTPDISKEQEHRRPSP
jgi:hypothetical protein